MKLSFAISLVLLPVATFAADGVPGAHFIQNWDLNSDAVVTADELRERRSDVFYTFDSDEDGVLTAEEYTYFDEARALDMQGQGDHGQGRMKRVNDGMTLTFNDVDADGTVSRDEFVGQVDAWLALIDRNGDGEVTQADFGPNG